MPEISKINALAIGSVSKVDGLAKASILDIDGVVVPQPVSVPAAAYSVRLLGSAVGISSYTGPAMRVRRDTAGGTGDDDEADIAFDSGVISLDSAISNASAGVTATTLGQFLNVGTVGGTTYSNPDSLSGTASCFVDEWKDQSGNANHASQATFGSQPQIHSGTVNTDLITENGKPSLEFDDSASQHLDLPVTGTVANATGVLVRTAEGMPSTHEGTAFNYKTFGITYGHKTNINYRNAVIFRNTTAFRLSTYPTTDEQALDFFTALETSSGAFTSNVAMYRNSVAGDSGVTANAYGSGTNQIGAWQTQFYRGGIQELLIWESDQSSNRTGIESDINTYFSIY